MGDDGQDALDLAASGIGNLKGWIDGNLGTPPSYNCTAKDIKIASAIIDSISPTGNPGTYVKVDPSATLSCTPLNPLHVKVTAQLQNSSKQRYDVGIWIPKTTNASAMNDDKGLLTEHQCRHYNLLPNVQGANSVDNDSCGDMSAAAGLVNVFLDELLVQCTAGQAKVTVNNCVAWANSDLSTVRGSCPATRIPNQAGPQTTDLTGSQALGFRYGTVPENGAKCNCTPFELPIEVRGRITIIKNTVGGDGAFQFSHDVGTNSNPTVATPFTINTSTNTGTQVIDEVKPGTYHITELAPPSTFDFTSLSCTADNAYGSATVNQTTRQATVVLQNGGEVTCTYVNTKKTSLTLDKVTSYTGGGTRPESDWTLTATGTGATPTNLSGPGAAGSTDVVSGPTFKPDTYTLAETGTYAGYTNGTAYSCVKNGGAAVVGNTITLAAGDVAVCTITNTDVAPSLTLDKVTSYTHGGTRPESDWNLTATGTGATPTNLSGPGAAGSTDVVSGPSFKADTYTLAETGTYAGYTNGTAYSCVKNGGAAVVGNTITLATGDVAVCTITNTDVAPSLTLNKVTSYTHGGTRPESDWNLTATGTGGSPTNLSGPGAAGSTDVVSGSSFKADTYTLAETGTYAGYTNGTAYSCVKNGGAAVSGNSITLAVGDVAVCTITNTDVGGSLTLNKVTSYTHGGTRPESDWTLTATGTGATPTNLSGPGAAGSADVVSGSNFKPDTYTLGETGSYTGYTNGTTYSCVKNGGAAVVSNTITMDVGDVAVCTITNTDVAPSLTLDKVTSYTHGGTRPESDWTLTADGGTAGTLSGAGAAGSTDVVSGSSFKAGTYALSETGSYTGYTNGTAYSCAKNGGAAVSGNSITLAVGDAAVCTITNTDVAPSLTLNKVTSYTHGGTAPESDWTLTATGTGATPTNLSGPGAAGSADVVSGSTFKADTYTLSESAAAAGYQNGTAYSCVKNGAAAVSGNTITLGVGDVAVCTITNTDLPRPVLGAIAPTNTTCEEFKTGQFQPLASLLAQVKSSKIGTISPGVFFYYANVDKTTTGAVGFTQTVVPGTMTLPLYQVQQGQAYLYSYNATTNQCTRVATLTPSSASTYTGGSGLPVGSYILGVKFSPDVAKGLTTTPLNPAPLTVLSTHHYELLDGSAPGDVQTQVKP